MLKIGVLVSGGGTNLQAILDEMERDNLCGARVVTVVSSSPKAYALERAKAHGVEGTVISKKDFSDKVEYENAMISHLREKGVELVVLAGFMVVLGPTFIRAFENRILNIHPALIPSFCGDGFYGLHVHEAALAKGVKVSGATVHFVNEETDGGPIILQKAVPVLEGDTPAVLQKRIMEEAEWKLLPEAIRLFAQGRLRVEGGRVHIGEETE